MDNAKKFMSEHQEVAVLLHRWANLRSVHGAYKVFLHEEVVVGENRVCSEVSQVKQVATSLLTVYYSYLYSIFDKPAKSINFFEITEPLLSSLDPKAAEVWHYIQGLWSLIEVQMRDLRHKIGFHGERTIAGMNHGYNQFNDINPLVPDQIMLWMTVFFRYIDLGFQITEPHGGSINQTEVGNFFAHALGQQEKLAGLLFMRSEELIKTMAIEFLASESSVEDVKKAVLDWFYSMIGYEPESLLCSDTLTK